jgi:hypothetical protein
VVGPFWWGGTKYREIFDRFRTIFIVQNEDKYLSEGLRNLRFFKKSPRLLRQSHIVNKLF